MIRQRAGVAAGQKHLKNDYSLIHMGGLPMVDLLLPKPRSEGVPGSADRQRVSRGKTCSMPAWAGGTSRIG